MYLYDFLRTEYDHPWGGPSTAMVPIRIDDQGKQDVYHAFCRMAVTMLDQGSNTFSLTLSNVPWDEHVEALAEQLGGKWSHIPTGRCLTLEMGIKNVTQIRKLAEEIGRAHV